MVTKNRTASLILFILFANLWLALGQAFAQQSISVNGTLLQGTADGQPLPDSLPLQLSLLAPDGSVQQVFETSSAGGSFRFTDVPQQADTLYVLSTSWMGVEQTSLPFTAADLLSPLEFPLYESSDSLQEVVAHRGRLRIDFQETRALGAQILVDLTYVNVGDRIISANQPVLELPVGALAIAPEENPQGPSRYQITQQDASGLPIPRVIDTQALMPGWGNRLTLSFILPYEDGAVIDMRLPFAVDNFEIAVREETLYIESETFAPAGKSETESGLSYQLYQQTHSLLPNEALKFSLVGEPVPTVQAARPAINDSSQDTLLLMGAVVAVGLMLMLGLGVWLLQARRKESQAE